MLILPSFLLLGFFEFYPLLSAFYHSLFDWNVVTSKFIGLNNYTTFLTKPIFWISIKNILIFMAFSIPVTLLMTLLGAELIFNLKSDKVQSFWKYTFILPMVVPFSVGILIWGFIYTPYIGVLWQFLNIIGLGNLNFSVLGNPKTAIFFLALIGFPYLQSLAFLVFLSSLLGLDKSILESAEIDGASKMRRILSIDLPMIKDKIFLIVSLDMIGAPQTIGSMLLLTGGGPGNSTMTPALYIYNSAFNENKMGYASAGGVVLMSIVLGLFFLTQSVESYFGGEKREKDEKNFR
ncbi:MAG: sugar ABC transporter permease [Candidatus Parvarchaeota archaeon]|nr:sugar ABC transporter permease [Candidatus Jingweiarchaeum tengchongense]